MIKAISMRGASAMLALALLSGSALAQEVAPDGAPAAPVAPPPVQAAPDSGPPPADAPAAQSPAEMPVDQGTVNDLPDAPPAGGTAPAPAPAPAAPGADAPATTPPPPASAPAAAPDGSAAAAPAWDDVASKVAAFDPYVEDMQVVGPWTEGDKAGVWRTVMLREADDPEAYRFFVQKITDDGGKLVVQDTTEITELASVDGGVVGYRAEESEGGASDGLTLFFDIVPSDGEISETYELHFFGAGKPYQFGPASN